jgi:hypothetical protein
LKARPSFTLEKQKGHEPSGLWVHVRIHIRNLEVLAALVGESERDVRDDAWNNSQLHPRHWRGEAYRQSEPWHYSVRFQDPNDLFAWMILT